MPRKDPSLLPPLPLFREAVTVTDPRAPGDSWDFTFEVEEGAAITSRNGYDIAERYIAQYANSSDGIRINGREVRVGETMCRNIGSIMAADASPIETMPNPDPSKFPIEIPRWGFNHWFIFAYHCPSAFNMVLEKVSELVLKACGLDKDEEPPADNEAGIKNSLPASGDSTSVPPQPSDIPTPT